LATALGQKHDRAYVMGGGFAIAAAGFGVMTQVHRGEPLVILIAGAGLLATGLVMVLTLVTELVVATAAPERAGTASALMETGSEFGGSLGIAVLGSIGAAVYGSIVPDRLPAGLGSSAEHAARESLAGASAVSAHLPSRIGDAVLARARSAFTSGMNTVAIVGAVILVAAAVSTVVVLRRA
jgi:DHA2 family multidrug resistance protein-like MFS transporter